MSAFRRAAAVGAFTAVLAAGAFGAASAANADPTSPSTDTYAAVGSDTIQDLYNSFESGQHIASWNATGSTTIVPKNILNPNTAAAAITRPNGSGDGRKALSAAWNSANHVFTPASGAAATVPTDSIDIARSSGKPGTIVAAGASNDQLTSVPLARDAVAVATNASGSASGLATQVFSRAELEAIFGAPNDTTTGGDPVASTGVYHQNASASVFTVGDIDRNTASTTAKPRLVAAVSSTGAITSAINLNPLLPQSSSGTRQFFQKAIGNTANSTATWVTSNASVEENTASVVTGAGAGAIIPFSAAQYIWQYNTTSGTTGVHAAGFTENSIVKLDGTTGTPAVISGTTAAPGTLFGSTTAVPGGLVGEFDRDVYSVVPTQVINGTFAPGSVDPTYDADVKTLVTSTLPSSSNIGTFGFEAIAYSATTSNWIHSPFEN